MRKSGGLEQDGNLESSKKWLSSGYISKGKTIGFVYVVYEKGRESRINPKILTWAIGRMELPFTKMDKALVNSRLKGKIRRLTH